MKLTIEDIIKLYESKGFRIDPLDGEFPAEEPGDNIVKRFWALKQDVDAVAIYQTKDNKVWTSDPYFGDISHKDLNGAQTHLSSFLGYY